MIQTTFTTQFEYGPIHIGFPIHLEGKYIAILGRNGSGKTSLLNVLFQKNQREKAEGKTQICLISSARNISTIVQSSGRTLEQYNAKLAKTIEEGNGRDYTANSDELANLLLNHNNFTKQVQKLNDYLEYLGLPEYTIQEIPHSFSPQHQMSLPGSGRYILPVLAALTDDHIKTVLIDEAYVLLQPQLQKRLRDLFFEVSQEKQIIVASHSNVCINTKDYTSNYFITRKNDEFCILRATSKEQLESISSSEITLVEALVKAVPSIMPTLRTSLDIEEPTSKKKENIRQVTETIQEMREDINITIFYEMLKESIKHNKDELARRHTQRVQQTNIAYYVTLVCLVLSVLLVFMGVILIFIGKLEGGILTTVSSAITSVISGLVFVFNKQVNDQELEDSQQMRSLEKTYGAMGIVYYIKDEKKKDEIIEKLIEENFFMK